MEICDNNINSCCTFEEDCSQNIEIVKETLENSFLLDFIGCIDR